MKTIRFDLLHIPQIKEGLTLALGEFDGLHVGHQKLLLTAAYEASFDSGILLFAAHFPGKGNDVLTSIDDRISLLSSSKVDYAYVLEEKETIYQMEAEDYIHQVLLPLGTKQVVVGEDYRFGKDGKGDIALLGRYFKVIVVPFASLGGSKVATRRIKEVIKEGKVEEARNLLGHPYTIKGKTVRGKHLGSSIGFPTLNLDLSENYVIPKYGVYFAIAYFKGRYYKSLVNIGVRPTVDGDSLSVEAYLFGYEGTGDYGFTCYLDLLSFHRPEKKFASLEALQAQIEKDKAWALSLHD